MKPLIPWRLLLVSILLTFLTAAIPSIASAQTDPPPPPQLERQQLLFHPGEAPIQGSVRRANNAPGDINPYSRLVFQSLRDGDWEIFLGAFQGAPETRLTQNTSPDIEPRLNRGATKIVYVSKRQNDYEISSMNLDGSQSTELTKNAVDDLAPSWSPDGTKILFSSMRDGQSEIYVMNADGSNQVRLTNDPEYDGMPDWSPDGTKIIFVSRRTSGYRVWLANADGSSPQQLSAQANSMHPRWSPDGTKIAYDADDDNNGWQGLWLMNADGNNQHMLYGGDNFTEQDWLMGSWMTDSQNIALTHIIYTQYQGKWYWMTGTIYNYNVNSSGYPDNNAISSSATDWYPDWQSNDLKAPVSHFGKLPSPSPAKINLTWGAQDVGPAGVDTYDVQMKEGASGAWTDLLTGSSSTSTEYMGLSGHSYTFRVRATDHARNQENWNVAPMITTTIETLPPITTFNPMPDSTSNNFVSIGWKSTEPGNSGVASYDFQYRIGLNGQWKDRPSNVYLNKGWTEYYGSYGVTVYFRVRGIDAAGNIEAWHGPEDDIRVTFYNWKITGNIFDNSGSPISGAHLALTPAAILDSLSSLLGGFTAYGLTDNPAYAAVWSKNGYGSPPATSFQTSYPAAREIALPPADNKISDGGFETGQLPNTAWQTAGNPASHRTSQFHTGAQAATVGQPYWGDTEDVAIALGYDNSMGVDSQGTLHLVYPTYIPWLGVSHISYASRSADGVWSSPIDPFGNTSANSIKLAIDASNTLHIVWTSSSGTWYATKASGADWSAPSQISAKSIYNVDIAVGPDGQPHVIGALDGIGLVYTHQSQGAWAAFITITTKMPSTLSIQVSPDGTVHVLSWLYIDNLGSYYFNLPSGGSWSTGEVISNEIGLSTPFLKMDFDGTLYAFWVNPDGGFEYRRKPTSQPWETMEIIKLTAFPLQPSPLDFAVNHGKIALLYKTMVDGTMVYIEKLNGETQSTEKVIAPTSPWIIVGRLAAGPGGKFYLVYNDRAVSKILRTYPSTQTGEAVISQTLTIPAGPSASRLSFFYQLGGASAANATGFKVQVQASGITTDLLATQTNTTDWTFQSYDLSAWGGQTVTLSFRANQVTGNLPTWALLDDVALGSSYADVWSSLPAISGWPGSLVTTTLTCGNQGGAPASDVDIALTLPEGVSLVSAVPTPDSLLPTPTWHIGSVAAKTQACAIQLQLQLAPTLAVPGKLALQTNLTTSSSELETANNQTTADLTLPYSTLYLPQIFFPLP